MSAGTRLPTCRYFHKLAIAGLATVLTSMASALSNLPLLHQQLRDWNVTRGLMLLSSDVIAAGLIAIWIVNRLQAR